MDHNIYNRPQDYDEQYASYRSDIPFILWLAQTYSKGTPILEFAPGTLRVTLELARAGHTVVGVDLSEDMLAWGKQKLAQEPLDVQNRVTLHHGNMCDYVTGKQYDLVTVPFTSFLHVLGTENQLAALKNFHNHLLPGGHLLIDIFNPFVDRLAHSTQRLSTPVFEKRDTLANGDILVRYQTTHYDQALQQSHWVFYVEIYDARGEMKRKYTEDATVQIIFPLEWKLLLKSAEFEIVEEFGDHERNPFTANSNRMLFVSRKA